MLELTEEQLNHLNQWAQIGNDIIDYYGIDKSRTAFENLDDIYEKWRLDTNEKPSNDEMVVGMGSIFGYELKHKYNVEWCMVSDENGTDYAMIFAEKNYVFPIDFVAKRVYDSPNESGFFSGLEKILAEKVAESA